MQLGLVLVKITQGLGVLCVSGTFSRCGEPRDFLNMVFCLSSLHLGVPSFLLPFSPTDPGSVVFWNRYSSFSLFHLFHIHLAVLKDISLRKWVS